MDSGHDVDGLEVDRILRLRGVDLIARDEGELADMIGEFREGELGAVKAAIAEEGEIELVVGLEIV